MCEHMLISASRFKQTPLCSWTFVVLLLTVLLGVADHPYDEGTLNSLRNYPIMT